ncbi:MAG: hypothetical protein AB8H03_08360 [Saprospiraceae bacterium]
MKTILIITALILNATLSAGQTHEISFSMRAGISSDSFSKSSTNFDSEFGYNRIQTVSDKGLFLNYGYKFSKRFNLFLTAGFGYSKELHQFPILAREITFVRQVHLVDFEKDRLAINFFGLKKRFTNKRKNFSLELGILYNQRYYTENLERIVEENWQVSDRLNWIEYRYDIEVIHGEYKIDFNHGKKRNRIGRGQIELGKFDLELTALWNITNELKFTFGAAISPRHIFYYNHDYESRKYINGELDPAGSINYVGVAGDSDYNGFGKKNNFYYLTSGLTYSFRKRKNKEN